MCIDAPESTTISRSSGFCEKGAGITHASVGEQDAASSSHFSPSPMVLCGCIFLAAKYHPVFFPRILAHTNSAPEVHTFAELLTMHLFFPEFKRGVMCPLASLTLRFDALLEHEGTIVPSVHGWVRG